jgi:hypothetical protein
MFRKHFYRGVLQCVLEERFAEQRPTGGKNGGASNSETEGTAAGGPPSETTQGNRETGWKVGAQKKVAAEAAASSAESSTSTPANVDVDSRGGAVDDIGEARVARLSDASTSQAESDAVEQSSRQVQGKGKSWDQVVNAKVRSGSFASYAAAALQRLGLETDISAARVTEAELEQYERQHSHRHQEIAVRSALHSLPACCDLLSWPHLSCFEVNHYRLAGLLQVFWTIRAVLAPLLEGLLLLDRTLYLHDECNCGA